MALRYPQCSRGYSLLYSFGYDDLFMPCHTGTVHCFVYHYCSCLWHPYATHVGSILFGRHPCWQEMNRRITFSWFWEEAFSEFICWDKSRDCYNYFCHRHFSPLLSLLFIYLEIIYFAVQTPWAKMPPPPPPEVCEIIQFQIGGLVQTHSPACFCSLAWSIQSAFSCNRGFQFRLIFHWSLPLRAQLGPSTIARNTALARGRRAKQPEVGTDQGWGQVKYLYLVLGTWCKISSTWYLLVLDTLEFKSTWYLLVLEGKVLGTCPSTFKYFCQINMYIQA